MSNNTMDNNKSVWAVIKRAEQLCLEDNRFTIGYALYNALWEVDKATAKALLDTDKDPAMNHDNIDRFIAHLCFRFGVK
jgi:hypothetical protein